MRLTRLLAAFRRRRVDPRVTSDVDEEIDFHLERRAGELTRAGLSQEEAAARARLEFGDLLAAQRDLTTIDRRILRSRRHVAWFADFWQDLLYGARMFARAPGTTAVLLVTLATGIGATTAIFSVLNAVLLRPLPYREPGRLVQIWETHSGSVDGRSEASFPDFLDWRTQAADSFEAIEGYDQTNVSIVVGGEPTMMRGGRVTPGFLRMLGLAPEEGRDFMLSEDAPGGLPIVIVSAKLASLLGNAGRPGGTIAINGRPYTVIGHLPRGFTFAPLQDAEMLMPLDASSGRRAQRFNHWLTVVARLRSGVTIGTARQTMDTVMRRLALQYPETNSGRGGFVVPLRDEIVRDLRPIVLALSAAVALVLLIACANVSSLLLGRSLARRRETAVRGALGATAGRLARQWLTESLLLSLLGAFLGIILARGGVTYLIGAIPESVLISFPTLRDVSVDRQIFWFVLATTVITATVCGLAPALFAARSSISDFIGRGAGAQTGRDAWWRDAIVVFEVGMTLVLMVGAGLMGRSLLQLLRTDVGFQPAHVATLRVALSGPAYQSDESQQRFFETAMPALRGIRGTDVVGGVTNLPLNGGGTNTFHVEGLPEPPQSRRPEAVMRGVAGDYFAALGIRVDEGRTFDDRDRAGSPLVIVISRALARRHLPNLHSVGQRIRFYAFPDRTWEVIGVVDDVKTGALDGEAPPTVYTTHLQVAANRLSLVLRTTGDPAGVLPDMRHAVRRLDPSALIYAAQIMDDVIAGSPAVFSRRYPLVLIGSFAVTALALAAIGIYGVLAFAVAQRRREIGLRLALGATRAQILQLILRRGIWLLALGIAWGAVGAFFLSRGLASLLYGVDAADPVTFVGVALTLATVGLAASYLPGRRAMRLDPAVTLRAE